MAENDNNNWFLSNKKVLTLVKNHMDQGKIFLDQNRVLKQNSVFNVVHLYDNVSYKNSRMDDGPNWSVFYDYDNDTYIFDYTANFPKEIYKKILQLQHIIFTVEEYQECLDKLEDQKKTNFIK